MSENPILWQPHDDAMRNTAMHRFMAGCGCGDYRDLYQWSIGRRGGFRDALADFWDIAEPGTE